MNPNAKNFVVISKRVVWSIPSHVRSSIDFHQWALLLVCLGALVALYEEAEKPNNANEFVRRFMGASGPDSAEIEAVKSELTAANERIEDLVRENEALKEKLQKYEGGQ